MPVWGLSAAAAAGARPAAPSAAAPPGGPQVAEAFPACPLDYIDRPEDATAELVPWSVLVMRATDPAVVAVSKAAQDEVLYCVLDSGFVSAGRVQLIARAPAAAGHPCRLCPESV